MIAQVKAAADHCARAAYPHHDAPGNDIHGWKLWDAVWKEEEYDSPKRGAIPKQWIRNRSWFWLGSDGRLLFLETEEIERPGWVEIPGYGWTCEGEIQRWSHPPYVKEVESVDELRSTYSYLGEKRYQTSRTPGSKYTTTINSVHLGNKDAAQWLHGVLDRTTRQADAEAVQHLAERKAREEREARERAARAAAIERAIAKARSVANTPFRASQPSPDVRLKFGQALMAFRDAELAAIRFGRPTAVVEKSDDGAWAVMRLQPRSGRVRWWHLYADVHGAVQIARHGRGTSSTDEDVENAFLARDAAVHSRLAASAEWAQDNDDDDVWQIGVYGAGAVIASGILALIFPSSESILRGSFTQILRVQAADLEAAMTPYAVPAIVGGIALLAIDLVLWLARDWVPARKVVVATTVAQAVLGGVAVIAPVIFGGLLLINLVVWIAETILVFAVVGLIIFGLFAASADG